MIATASSDAARTATLRFEELLDRCERVRASALPFDELAELGRLYRQHLGRLARLRERGQDLGAIAYLNGLCLRAHTVLFVPPKVPWSVATFLRETLPGALARTWRVQVLGWGLLASGILVGGALVVRDPLAAQQLIPQAMCGSPDRLEGLVRSTDARQEFLAREETPASMNLVFGSFLFAHNTRVGLLSFATGVLAAVPTIVLHVYNGIVVGAFSAIFLRDPWPVAYLAWILPHGIPELTAINLCAAAGLLLGGAVALPGRRSRAAALREAVTPALTLVAGSIPLFALAAVTESFVRESALGTPARLAVAGAYATALGLGSYGVRRLSRRGGADASWLADVMPRRSFGSSDIGSTPRA